MVSFQLPKMSVSGPMHRQARRGPTILGYMAWWGVREERSYEVLWEFVLSANT